MYYLLCPKIGKVFSDSNKRHFKDFPVSGEWIFSMLQSMKMETEDARKELVLVGKGLCMKMTDLEKLVQVRREQKIWARIDAVQKKIAEGSLAFKNYPVVDAWKEQATKPYQRRKQFLVLEGPSGVGKTEFVRGLFGADALLELNCANCSAVPDLRTFNYDLHKVLLFDEAPLTMVLKNRKLFQAPCCLLDLGHSPTGRDVYRIWLNDAVLVIASNRWTEELEAVESESDRAWIKANQVWVFVKESMFQVDQAAKNSEVKDA